MSEHPAKAAAPNEFIVTDKCDERQFLTDEIAPLEHAKLTHEPLTESDNLVVTITCCVLSVVLLFLSIWALVGNITATAAGRAALSGIFVAFGAPTIVFWIDVGIDIRVKHLNRAVTRTPVPTCAYEWLSLSSEYPAPWCFLSEALQEKCNSGLSATVKSELEAASELGAQLYACITQYLDDGFGLSEALKCGEMREEVATEARKRASACVDELRAIVAAHDEAISDTNRSAAELYLGRPIKFE